MAPPNCYTFYMIHRLLKRRITLPAAAILCVLGLYLVIPLPRFNPNYSTVVRDHEGRLLRAFLSTESQWHFPPDPKFRIPKPLLASVLMYEDRRFPWHAGVDLRAVLNAGWKNLRHMRIVGGASTITMQVVRLAERRPRTFINKCLEALQAIKLELHWSKTRILHTYLNHAPYGGNIVGVQAAARRYFGKPPGQLTWSEAATLAVLPNSPGLISPMMNRNRLQAKRNALLLRLKHAGVIPPAITRLAIQEPIPKLLHSFQIAGPHWAQRFHNDQAFQGRLVHTTLDLDIQSAVEYSVSAHARRLMRQGIRHTAVVVLDTRTGDVRAYVGSPDYFDSANHGQVDGAAAPRSTGSILKPFLYALSMDSGLILPRTLIHDVPTFYGAFSPANADREYSGLVTARKALIQSLNVPAVRLLNLYGTERFYHFLESAGLSSLFRTPDEYGLTLILGGGEARLLELTALYRGLGADGEFHPAITYAGPAPHFFQPQLISSQACYLTLDILRHLKRPGAEYYWQQFSSSRPVAWKTGTSYGQRDGWSIGLTPAWTIGIWVGNFNGEGNPLLSGAGSAAPLMFQLFNTLPTGNREPWFSRRGMAFQRITLCQDSGFRAGPDCPHTVTVDAPLRARPLPVCPYHRSFFVTLDEKHRVCSQCWTPGNYKRTVRLVLPPEVAQFMRSRGLPNEPLPPHLPGCSVIQVDRPMRFVYPEPRARVMIPRDFQGVRQRITVSVAHRNPESRIFWYVDGVYLGETRGIHKNPMLLDPGWHRIVVVDEDGHQQERRLLVVGASGTNSG